MTTASTTAPAQGTDEIADAGHVDVLIIGAGVSGIGAAHHLRDKFPDRTFVILDAQDNRGGTWWTHRYPGVRSDSDMYTLGYRFKPWEDAKAIADGPSILRYVKDTARENGIDSKIHFNHRVERAVFRHRVAPDRTITIAARREGTRVQATITCDGERAATATLRYHVSP